MTLFVRQLLSPAILLRVIDFPDKIVREQLCESTVDDGNWISDNAWDLILVSILSSTDNGGTMEQIKAREAN